MTNPSLSGKAALITGAASGIGRATAIAFGNAGVKKFILLDTDQSGLETLAVDLQTLKEHGGIQIVSMIVDVANESQLEMACDKATTTYGALDIAVLNAGVAHPRAPTHELDSAAFDRTIQVNLYGVFYGLKHAARVMLKNPREGQNIILTGSQLGLDGEKGLSGYCASKFAVRGLMACAAQEYGERGIRVNTVCPGPIATPMSDGMAQADVDAVVSRTLLKRLGHDTEIADAMVFLASNAYTTGTTLKVDGGYSRFA